MARSNSAETRGPTIARRRVLALAASAAALPVACIAPNAEQQPAPVPAAIAATPTHVARSSATSAPVGAASAGPDGGAISAESDWKAQSTPICTAAPQTDAGKLEASGSTVDWAKLDAGAAPVQTVSNASRVVAGMRSGFHLCYQEELGRNRGGSGTVRLTIRIGCDGSVVGVHGSAHGNDQETIDCMFKVVTGSRFEPPEGGSAVIAVPVTFVQG